MTAQNDEKETPRQDWNQLAKQALDLWQGHLTALSKDEKAKADMANMMRPMTQMATQWADMVQKTVAATKPQPQSQESQAEETGAAYQQPEMEEAQESRAAEKEQHDLKSDDEPADDVQPASAQPEPEPAEPKQHDEPVAERHPSEPVSTKSESEPKPTPEPAKSASGDSALASSSGDLADIAARLAELEQALDTLRPRTNGSAEPDEQSATGS